MPFRKYREMQGWGPAGVGRGELVFTEFCLEAFQYNLRSPFFSLTARFAYISLAIPLLTDHEDLRSSTIQERTMKGLQSLVLYYS